jgi:uncharacterized protein with GYD domain
LLIRRAITYWFARRGVPQVLAYLGRKEIAMTTFVMIGKYTGGAIGAISAQRTEEAKQILKQCGGELKAGYATLGETDVVLICTLPNAEAAFKASVALTKALGIAFSTSPALSVEEFDKTVGA